MEAAPDEACALLVVVWLAARATPGVVALPAAQPPLYALRNNTDVTLRFAQADAPPAAAGWVVPPRTCASFGWWAHASLAHKLVVSVEPDASDALVVATTTTRRSLGVFGGGEVRAVVDADALGAKDKTLPTQRAGTLYVSVKPEGNTKCVSVRGGYAAEAAPAFEEKSGSAEEEEEAALMQPRTSAFVETRVEESYENERWDALSRTWRRPFLAADRAHWSNRAGGKKATRARPPPGGFEVSLVVRISPLNNYE